MLPLPGLYRLTGPASASAIVQVTAGPPATMVTTFGTYTYDPPSDLFVRGLDRAVKCLGDGRFRAIEGPDVYEGTCTPL